MKASGTSLGFLLCCLLSASSVSAGDTKAYSSGFCQPYGYQARAKDPWGYTAQEDQAVVCPILRDDNSLSDLPQVNVEAHQASGSENLSCSVWWLNEDGGTTIRGVSQSLSTSTLGVVQLAFDSLTKYDSGAGYALSLSAGGEGTLSVVCVLETNDTLVQYYVREDAY